MVHKGYNSEIDSYSAFFDNKKLGHTDMENILRNAGVTDCFVCGIAYDYCVGANLLHEGIMSQARKFSRHNC